MLNNKIFNAKTPMSSYLGKVWRTVETQETAATLNIVDSMLEQGVLEELLDRVKPPYREGTEGKHYLLKTAFRYPPLKHGSRFGRRSQASYFYASEDIKTSLAETAYYRFVFLNDISETYTKAIDSKHCVFSVNLNTSRCVDLHSEYFKTEKALIKHPSDYRYTQAIGSWAMENGIELTRFESARHAQHANLAISEPKVIRSKAPITRQHWLCRTKAHIISFNSREAKIPVSFSLDQFLVDGKLPRPS